MLASRGARVACLDLDISTVEAPAVGVLGNVTDDDSVRAGIAEVVATFGGIDIVVNNAAVGAVGSIADTDDATWQRVLDVDVVGLVRVTRAALPHLRRS